MRKRKFFIAHRWLGRLTLLLLIWYVVTALGVLAATRWHWYQAPTWQPRLDKNRISEQDISAKEPQIEWHHLIQKLNDMGPKGFIELPIHKPDRQWQVRVPHVTHSDQQIASERWYWLNPSDLTVQAQGDWSDSALAAWTKWHRGQMFPEFMRPTWIALTWLLLIGLCVAATFGIPKRRWPKSASGKQRVLHQYLGWFLLPFMLLGLCTGLVYAHIKMIKPHLGPIIHEQAKVLDDIQQMWTWLQADYPHSKLRRIHWSEGQLKIRIVLGGEWHPNGSQYLYLSPMPISKSAFSISEQAARPPLPVSYAVKAVMADRQNIKRQALSFSWVLHSMSYLPASGYWTLLIAILVASIALALMVVYRWYGKAKMIAIKQWARWTQA